jgi:hypothetical protein
MTALKKSSPAKRREQLVWRIFKVNVQSDIGREARRLGFEASELNLSKEKKIGKEVEYPYEVSPSLGLNQVYMRSSMVS